MTSFEVTAGERFMRGSMVYVDVLTGLARSGIRQHGVLSKDWYNRQAEARMGSDAYGEKAAGGMVRYDDKTGYVSRSGIPFGRDGAVGWDGAIIGEEQIPLVDVIHYRLGTEPPDCIPAQAAPTTPIATVATGQTRDDVRRGIDLLLTEDARRTPAFATARRAAVLAFCECRSDTSRTHAALAIEACLAFEQCRGCARHPSPSAAGYVSTWEGSKAMTSALAAYERARGMP